jgi:hypothetical protein
MDRSAVLGDLPECLNGFVVSKVNSDLERAKGPNP